MSTERAGQGFDAELARAIVRRAREFELPALLDVVARCYPEPDWRVRFRSEPTTCARPTLIERVDLEQGLVVITLNAGLFSAATPLPTYFQRLLEDPHVLPSLRAVLEAVDDALLRAEAYSFYPEGAWRSPEALRQLRRNMLGSSQPASPATVTWLLEAAFPELTVQVERARLPSEVRVQQARVGYAVLGHDALGGQSTALTQGLYARLLGAAQCWTDVDWSVEAERRFKSLVEPSLERSGLRLRLVLDLLGVEHPLRLGGETTLGMGTLGQESREPLVLFDDVIA